MSQLEGIWSRMVRFTAIGLAGFHLYTGAFDLVTTPVQRAVHVGLTMILVLALYPPRKVIRSEHSVPWWDLALIVLILMSTANICINWPRYMPMMVAPATSFELVMAVSAIVVVLEGGRRTIDWIFPIITALSIAYALWGHFIPDQWGWGTRCMKWRFVLTHMYFSTSSIW
jgi:TRAP-type uncharacterized transport system fused permease subunit